MKTTKTKMSWVQSKLTNPVFKEGFDAEYTKISIGEQLLNLRHQADLTQAELASKVGTTGSAISRYENAGYDRYELQTLRKIVEACGGHLKIIFEAPNKHRHAV